MKTIKVINNGIEISVQSWKPWKKRPVLVVEFEGENCAYKGASFKDEKTAEWFCEILKEFFDDKQ